MIEIRNLSKIYRASLDKPCTAIDNLTLDLPSTGMVFITGKSGSGKSTLLNMIGTLDNISRGDIYVESRSVKKFTDKEAQEYRSSYLGFIFQDFLLLDELTVKENIELALNISGITDEQVFKDIIKRVDLEGKEDKEGIEELLGGVAMPQANSVWIGTDYFGLPNYEEWIDIFANEVVTKQLRGEKILLK